MRPADAFSAPRRRLLLGSLFAAGAWTIGLDPRVAHAQPKPPQVVDPDVPGFGIWLRFEGAALTLLTNITEMGQGTPSLMAAIAAEELGLPLDRIKIEMAPIEPRFDNPFTDSYVTYGSIGFRTAYATLAPVCAAARDMLQRAAAARWSVDAAACLLREGQVVHAPSRRELPISALLAEAAALRPPLTPNPKPRAQWAVLGQHRQRTDIPAKTDGRMAYGIDERQPGLLHAAVLHGPGFGARLVALDERPARAIQGVRKIVRLPGAVGVVADSWWTAQQASRRLKPRWAPGPHATLDSDTHAAELRAAVQAGRGDAFPKRLDTRLDEAAVTAALSAAGADAIEQLYEFPFLAHAPLEPLNATVRVDKEGAEIWVSTQSQSDTRAAVAKALGLATERVRLHSRPCGGGFGRRLEFDCAVEAALIARAVPGQPVKTIWSREVDMRAGFYRPASAARLRLALGADGLPAALRADMAGARIEDYSGVAGAPEDDVPDFASSMAWLGQSYALPALHLAFTKVDRGVPLAYWRSVGASQNTYCLETMIDRAARSRGDDPLAYRRRLLAGEGPRQRRALALLDALAARANWGQALPTGHHRGIALFEGNRAVSGHVVELAVSGPGRFKLIKIWAAIDAGWVGNPDAVQAQLMGGTVFGLAAALHGEISFASGEVREGNFDTYRLPTMAELPPIDLLVVGNGERPAGVGEEGVPTIAPAIANALFAATGQPVARLPLVRAGWQA
ncbi:MAG TPA: molybdopterin cofactor-binding domain-containing protein [Ideonella sp.]|uniref:xanthine dehydrogenase family protein molybdopterin-binding subunit n=1 Tax=Ideonella sp. TaxID=1929293 RepID=UPI002E3272A8|nr:molybdopterin cofactor-binding domain-containing protein [Ideonella sp.]HEX5688300.1 molybdopterin cofactor-binding domain-containing protein [Ideonella sp.]